MTPHVEDAHPASSRRSLQSCSFPVILTVLVGVTGLRLWVLSFEQYSATSLGSVTVEDPKAIAALALGQDAENQLNRNEQATHGVRSHIVTDQHHGAIMSQISTKKKSSDSRITTLTNQRTRRKGSSEGGREREGEGE
eukprot:CAMPEP_0181296418 /NCGR_PEP_ID=MMETSP1101-20121128/4693_1 /TAXON_ID=46948 /ORGANISM="Rhodomonas abbreviata, Strain Caron Lab Isolate" /LENGTH=137 /DNA_ID=CAMNT_0023401281 /DNA_START=107 /DNA_END=517 /DNA_ORIENTATION=-